MEDAPPDVAAAFDATTRRALPAIFLGIGAFYLAMAVVVPWLPTEVGPSRGLVARWAAMAAVGLAGGIVFRRWTPPSGWSTPIVGLLGAVTVLNGLLLIDEAGPSFLFALIVALVAFSLFLLSLPWVAGLVALSLGGWLAMATLAGGGPAWTPRTINLVAFCVVALVAQSMRVGLHRRLEVLKARDLQRAAREGELAREKALHEQRRRLVRMTSHELATPLTPVLLQAHLLAMSDLTPKQREALDAMQRNLDRLQATIRKVVKAAQADDDTAYEGAADHDLGPAPPPRGP